VLEWIALGLQDAAGGTPGAIFLSGTAGIGLSRLLAETRKRVEGLADPFVAVHGCALPATSGVPYAPVTAALERLLQPLTDEVLAALVGPTGDAIATLIPELAPRLEELDLLPARPRIAAPEWREARVFEAVLGLLERLGERRPVALLLEDLHNADAGTRGLVSFLARATRSRRVLLIATCQPDRLLRNHPLRTTLAGLSGSPGVTMADVPPLDRAELAQLLEAIEGTRPSSTTLLLVAERSGGSPLVAEEVLAARREQLGVSMSGSLERLVTARASRRTPECRRVLRLLSLTGSMVSVPTLMAIAEEFERRAMTRPPRSARGTRWGEGLEAEIGAGLAGGGRPTRIRLDPGPFVADGHVLPDSATPVRSKARHSYRSRGQLVSGRGVAGPRDRLGCSGHRRHRSGTLSRPALHRRAGAPHRCTVEVSAR